MDGHTDEEGVDPYDELGRTPPRQILARNRKWSADRKHAKEKNGHRWAVDSV